MSRFEKTRATRILRAVYYSCALLLTAVSLGLFTAAVVVPKLILHADTYIVDSGSMQPYLNPGDLVIANPRYDAALLKEGDVVTYLTSNINDPYGYTTIVHRVVAAKHNAEGTESEFVTKGDSNLTADEPIRGIDITGQVMYRIPLIGNLMSPRYSEPIIVTLGVLMGLVGIHYVQQRRRFKHDYGRP